MECTPCTAIDFPRPHGKIVAKIASGRPYEPSWSRRLGDMWGGAFSGADQRKCRECD